MGKKAVRCFKNQDGSDSHSFWKLNVLLPNKVSIVNNYIIIIIIQNNAKTGFLNVFIAKT